MEYSSVIIAYIYELQPFILEYVNVLFIQVHLRIF